MKAKAVLWLIFSGLAYSVFSASEGVTQPPGTDAAYSSIRAVGDIVEQIGLVAALVVAVRYLATQSESKDKLILDKDKAIADLLTTVVEKNTAAVARFDTNAAESADAMRNMTKALGEFTIAVRTLPETCYQIRMSETHRGENAPRQSFSVPP